MLGTSSAAGGLIAYVLEPHDLNNQVAFTWIVPLKAGQIVRTTADKIRTGDQS